MDGKDSLNDMFNASTAVGVTVVDVFGLIGGG
jgi:hypothetical protein